MTLNVYAHAMPEEEADFSFADFGGPKRPYTAPTPEASPEKKNAVSPCDRQRYKNLERETGSEPATLSLGREPDPEEDQ
jgi:hypothetical protein